MSSSHLLLFHYLIHYHFNLYKVFECLCEVSPLHFYVSNYHCPLEYWISLISLTWFTVIGWERALSKFCNVWYLFNTSVCVWTVFDYGRPYRCRTLGLIVWSQWVYLLSLFSIYVERACFWWCNWHLWSVLQVFDIVLIIVSRFSDYWLNMGLQLQWFTECILASLASLAQIAIGPYLLWLSRFDPIYVQYYDYGLVGIC